MSPEVATAWRRRSGPARSTGLLMGFSHCVAMCGPLVASLRHSRRGRPGTGAMPGAARAAAGQLPYHLGRVTTYGTHRRGHGAHRLLRQRGRPAGRPGRGRGAAGRRPHGGDGAGRGRRQSTWCASSRGAWRGRVMALLRPLAGQRRPVARSTRSASRSASSPAALSWTRPSSAPRPPGGPVPGLLWRSPSALGTVPGAAARRGGGERALGQRARGAPPPRRRAAGGAARRPLPAAGPRRPCPSL